MKRYYVLHFRDGERMDFNKRCIVIGTAGGMVHFKASGSLVILAMVPMHAIRMIELVEEDV